VNVLLDPSFLLSRRGSDWIARMLSHGEGSVLVGSRMFYECGADPETLCEFRAPFWGRGHSPYCTASDLDVGTMSTHYQELLEEVETSQLGPAGVIAADYLGIMRDTGAVLVARRRDLLDLVCQLGIPVVQRGRAAFEEEFDKRVWGNVTEPLVGALHRRTRYLAWVDRSSPDLQVQMVDVGRGKTY
jgi:hypothetical protein